MSNNPTTNQTSTVPYSTVHFDVERERKNAWVRAAQRNGMKLVPWIVEALDAASDAAKDAQVGKRPTNKNGLSK